MPARNVYIALAFIFISLFIASKTSVKEQVFRGAVSHLANAALNEVDADRLFEGALAGAADAVGDSPYTRYIPPRQKTDYMREIQGQFAGVGLSNFVKDEKTGEFYFVPLRGAPAAKSGLRFGDRIVEVDGKSVKKFSLFDLTSALRGDEKTVVRLKIRPRASISAFADAATTLQNAETPDSAETESAENPENSANVAQSSSSTAQTSESDALLRDVELTRAVVQQDVVSGDRLDENGDWIYTLKDYPEIGYVALEQFADATTPQTLSALDSLDKAGVSSVILDFRGNPGGFLPDAVAICDEFVAAGAPIVEVRDRSGAVQQIYRATDRPKKSFRVVVLVDDESASASEIVSAALQDAGIAAVGGARSYGKGTIQSLFELPLNLGMLRVTTAQFFRPSGKPIRRVDGADSWGVDPDAALAVELTPTQRFYRRWLRAVRASGPEADVAAPRIFAFTTAETDALLRRAAQTSDAFARLEALAELDVDPETAQDALKSETSEESEAESETLKPETPEESDNPLPPQNTPAPEAPFAPSGRAPYFDPQLDRAVDYLLGTLDADASQAAETPEETSNSEKAETSEADATSDAAE